MNNTEFIGKCKRKIMFIDFRYQGTTGLSLNQKATRPERIRLTFNNRSGHGDLNYDISEYERLIQVMMNTLSIAQTKMLCVICHDDLVGTEYREDK